MSELERTEPKNTANDVLLSIIIPYKDDPRLEIVLDALEKNGKENIEIIVVDDASEIPAETMIGNKARVIRMPRNMGAYAARNIGVAHATSQNLGFLDSDTIPSPFWVQEGLKLLYEKGPHDVMVGGPVWVFPETEKPTATEYLNMTTAFPMKHYAKKRHFLGGGNMIIQKATFQKVGWFDGSLTGSGDHEFGQRAKKHGVEIVYDEKVRVSHRAYNWQGAKKKARRLVDNELQRLQLQEPGYNRMKWVLEQFPGWYTHYKILKQQKIRLKGRILAIGALWARQCYRMLYQIRQIREKKPPKKMTWMLPGEAYVWISENLDHGSNVLEFGSGYGSAYLATKHRVTSVEYDPEWMDLFPNIQYIEDSVGNGRNDPIPIIEKIQGPYDLVIINGQKGRMDRMDVLRHPEILQKILSSSEHILIDDTQCEQERQVVDFLKENKTMQSRRISTRNGRKFDILCTNKGRCSSCP